MVNYLKQSEEKQFLQIQLNYDIPGTELLGIPISVRETELLFLDVTEGTDCADILWLDVERILKCETASEWESEDIPAVGLEIREKEGLKHGLLSYAMKNQRRVTCTVNGKDYAGAVMDFSEKMLVLRAINAAGQLDGIRCIRLDCIEELRAECRRRKKIARLYSASCNVGSESFLQKARKENAFCEYILFTAKRDFWKAML